MDTYLEFNHNLLLAMNVHSAIESNGNLHCSDFCLLNVSVHLLQKKENC